MLSYLKIPIILTIITLVLSFFLGGASALFIVAILALLEVSLSFDNAIVNAKILKRMNEKWQKLFLTVGILIAVFGMRLLFPVLIVSITSGLDPISAVTLALSKPDQYEHFILAAHPAIAAFGGMFLLMLFINWLIDEKEHNWISPIERFFEKIKLNSMLVSGAISLIVLFLASLLGHTEQVITSGIVGIVVYLAISSIDKFFNEDTVETVAKAGIVTFLYLEILDASFSFDGVIGAFAVTNNIILIAVGLGIGALYIRGMTVYLTRSGKLSEFRYLEHGAHYAIGCLALLLLATIKFEIPEIVTGLIGILFIVIAYFHSIKANKLNGKVI